MKQLCPSLCLRPLRIWRKLHIATLWRVAAWLGPHRMAPPRTVTRLRARDRRDACRDACQRRALSSHSEFQKPMPWHPGADHTCSWSLRVFDGLRDVLPPNLQLVREESVRLSDAESEVQAKQPALSFTSSCSCFDGNSFSGRARHALER
ncbi:hypothetical protein T492DRAFT_1036939 [Pavlovales sp. CCMP2436]|nr:hypothetical protein T492DRAFT_1036939 [Pavlovales sp. CCMP2436]